jgi:acyl dehydratase
MTSSRIPSRQLGDLIGQPIGVSSWITIDQPRIAAFAQCTGDHQWIHVDVERARRESPFTFEIEGEDKPALVALSQAMLMN